MYSVLLVSTWALALTHITGAPLWLTVFIPVLLTVICSIRAAMWWRIKTNIPLDSVILVTVRRTNRLAFLIAAGFTTWSLALYPYGEE
jgi:predicted signal transduction protein with EAL and GGDEF domain